MLMMDVVLIFAMLSVGLFAGLMMTLVVIMQQQWLTLEKEEYVQYFKGFLLIAKGNPIITVLTLTSFFLPLIMGIIHLISGNSYPGILMISSGVVFFIGCFVVTLRLNFPIYNKVIGWENAESVTDWKDVRNRFYVLNVIRMTSAILAFVLLSMAGLAI